MNASRRNTLSYSEFSEFVTFEPNRELRCPMPSSPEYLDITEKMGGFRRPYWIPIARDATLPKLYDGMLPMGDALVAAEASGSAPEIQRPDKVGRSGNLGLYLSDSYGMILIDVRADSPTMSKPSCAMALPGTPKNFLVRNNAIIAVINSLDGGHSGLIQFSLDGNTPQYLSSAYFENQGIIDARLFDDTLAVYTAEYEPRQEGAPFPIEIASRPRRSSFASSYYYERRVKSHQLRILGINPSLKEAHTEVFLHETAERTQESEVEATKRSSTLNPFLSASGEYLIVTQSQTESVFTGYVSQSYTTCAAGNYRDEPYKHCSTQWKRVRNPDYVAPSAGGVHTCSGTLHECLKRLGPRVSKYIEVPDGEVCTEGIAKMWTCTAYETKSYRYPTYRNDPYTKFIVYRFQAGEFLRLDDALAKVTDGNLEPTEEPFRIAGHVQKHDHMHFNEDVLYAISSAGTGASVVLAHDLNTFSIQGNSAIFVGRLSLGGPTTGGVSAKFTDRKIFISESESDYRATYNWSRMQTLDIADPVSPKIDNGVSIPTRLDQLVFLGDSLVGVGSAKMKMSMNREYDFGSLTAFSYGGVEVNSIVLGTDYQRYVHEVASDDQVLGVDPALNRILLPYSAYAPFDPEMPRDVHRLTMARVSGGRIGEEATFELPERPDRSLSIADDVAFSFSPRFAHVLHKEGEWRKKEIFNGEIPSSIYPSRAFPYLVRKFDRSSDYRFELVGDRGVASKDVVDTLTFRKATTGYCTPERVYFDQDRILIVSEPPGVYFDWKDCARDGTDLKVYMGYRITEAGFRPITDQRELVDLYEIIQLDLHCVTNPANRSGEEIRDFDELPSTAVCYPAKDFYDL